MSDIGSTTGETLPDAGPVAVAAAPEPTPAPVVKKGTIPNWVALLVIVIVFAGVFAVYSVLTAPHVNHFKSIKHPAKSA
jgi:hypothetical protein